MAKELGISAEENTSGKINNILSRRRLDPIAAGVAVFTGSRLLELGADVIFPHTLSDVLEGVGELDFLTQLRLNYALRGNSRTFESVADFLSDGGLQAFTKETAKQYLDAHHVSQVIYPNPKP